MGFLLWGQVLPLGISDTILDNLFIHLEGSLRWCGILEGCTLDVLSVCLNMHLEKLRDTTFAQEVDETRIPKEKKIERCLELLTNIKAQEYNQRCGYDYNYDVYFKSIPGSTNSTMESTATPDQKAHNKKVRKIAQELEEKEWNELMDILKTDLRNFWV